MNALKTIAVFTGSAKGQNPAFAQAATALGTAIAKMGATLVYGGASVGLMNVLAEAALTAGGAVIGVLPQSLKAFEIAHANLTELIIVDSLAERKDVIIEKSDAFIALPGGIGTLDELFEVYTLARLEYHRYPIGLLNTQGYYHALLEFLDTMTANGFLDQGTRDILCVAEQPNDLFDKMRQAKSIGALNQARFSHLNKNDRT